MPGRRFFKLTGQFIAPDGKLPGGVMLSLVDRDDYADDVIAMGAPLEDGTFSVTFTRESFNQDWFEDEDIPQIYLVLQRKTGDGWSVFFQKSFPGLRFAEGVEDLGKIDISEGNSEKPAYRGEPLEFSANCRLTLDDEALEHILGDVVPRVERLTGWPGLLDGVTLAQTDSLTEVVLAINEKATGEAGVMPWWGRLAERLRGMAFGGIAALYDPFSRTVWLDRHICSQAGLDLVKALLGHEFVHVGQFTRHPELVERYRRTLVTHALLDRYRRRADPAEPIPQGLLDDLLPAFLFMCNIEGHARYIENTWLRRAYPLQEYIPRVSLPLAAAALLIGVLSPRPADPQAAPESPTTTQQERALRQLLSLTDDAYKAEQYGCECWYRTLQRGDEPARFEPTLAGRCQGEFTRILADMWARKQGGEAAG